MFYVYLIKSAVDKSLYVGYSDNLKRRLEEHNKGENISTQHKTPFKLVYYEAYQSKSDAKYREKQLKRHSGALTHLKKRVKNSITGL